MHLIAFLFGGDDMEDDKKVAFSKFQCIFLMESETTSFLQSCNHKFVKNK